MNAAEDESGRTVQQTAWSEVSLDIVRMISRRVPLPELLASICRRTVEAFDLRQATIFYHHARAYGYVPVADYGTPATVFERFARSRYTLKTTPHFDEIAAGRTVVISDGPDLSAADRNLLDVTELRALALLPLHTADQTRGTMCAGVQRDGFTAAQIDGLEVVAHHAATAIYQARSLRAVEKSARFNAAISTLALDLTREQGRAGAMDLLCARVREIYGASTAFLLVLHGDHLASAAAAGDHSPSALSVALGDVGHPAVQAFTGCRVVLANELAPDRIAGFCSMLGIPLAGSDGVDGVLLVADRRHPRHFDPRMENDAVVLGALAATALRNLDLLAVLHETNAELRRVSGLKDEFLAHVTHDLRTPLNVIIGYGQLAEESTFGAVSPELRQILERIVGSAHQQLALVEDLLDLSRIELNTLSVRLGEVPLAPLFAEMEFALSGMLHNRPVRGLVFPVAASLAVRADPERLRQILINLLGNAAKFTKTGSIELWADSSADCVRLAVRDTGPGITVENQQWIFEAFRQVDGEHARFGAGLGLAIARRLCALMDGKLSLDSALGRGSTFYVTLPAVSAETSTRQLAT